MFMREIRTKRGSLTPKEGDLTCMLYMPSKINSVMKNKIFFKLFRPTHPNF